jgi:hypothetical protein
VVAFHEISIDTMMYHIYTYNCYRTSRCQ